MTLLRKLLLFFAALLVVFVCRIGTNPIPPYFLQKWLNFAKKRVTYTTKLTSVLFLNRFTELKKPEGT